MAPRSFAPPPPPATPEVKKVRTPHGTRVIRAITCTGCGKSDTVDFAPRKMDTVLCRTCAFEKLGIRDRDQAEHRQHAITCSLCHRQAEVPFLPRDPATATCKDCHLGIESRQEARSLSAKRISGGRVLRVRAPTA